MRLIADMVAFTVNEVPSWNPTNICSYHLQEAGATPVQEIAYALSTAMAVLDEVKARGQNRRAAVWLITVTRGDDPRQRVGLPGAGLGRQHFLVGEHADEVVAASVAGFVFSQLEVMPRWQ